jgi:hypothetical protein
VPFAIRLRLKDYWKKEFLTHLHDHPFTIFICATSDMIVFGTKNISTLPISVAWALPCRPHRVNFLAYGQRCASNT